MAKLFPHFWCAERSFSSSILGEYEYCWILLYYWIWILVSISCIKSFDSLQNQSFFQFVPLVYVIFSNRNLQLVGNYIHKMVIKFVFCKISLLWTSRYVLICCTHLTHFLWRNLFVMSCLTPSAISANILEIRLPITSNYPLQTVNSITNTLSPPPTVISENVLKICVNHLAVPIFMRILPILPTIMGYRMEVGGYFNEFCESSQNSHSLLTYTATFVLNY